MIFDDIFSGLDQTTARKIFYGLFSTDGLLRRLRTTVILATHSCMWLAFLFVSLAKEHAKSSLQWSSSTRLIWCYVSTVMARSQWRQVKATENWWNSVKHTNLRLANLKLPTILRRKRSTTIQKRLRTRMQPRTCAKEEIGAFGYSSLNPHRHGCLLRLL